ncbi:hypothetical protein CO172_02430 [Candidatus Uhrbacteria bacterium CG_4_9_14_3_um_filter_36_7]|uniref:YoaR-like putative peptidoglycan binding domain-containing protein n=1 Tax=Candidatus Uhrbacteria bacterium CG_4_9_14_3_um_filter_36_7 TaxID=1975033 RepID=A0A2M7XHA0_9BACT|nr:MAG: hypothetical protein CO172_02430 [Candidatus Uhrbacteria bacterium CG_4_9_14_3_um_filter_36_7]
MKFFERINHRLVISASLFIGGLFFLLFGIFFLHKTYQTRIAPNTFIGPFAVGGQTREQARQQLERATDYLMVSGIDVSINQKTKHLSFSSMTTAADDIFLETISFDIKKALDEAFYQNRSSHWFIDGFYLLFSYSSKHFISIPIELQIDALKKQLTELFKEDYTQAKNASFSFIFDENENKWQPILVPSKLGQEFSYKLFFDKLINQLGVLDSSKIIIPFISVTPQITEEDIEPLLMKASSIINEPTMRLMYSSGKSVMVWEISADMRRQGLIPEKLDQSVTLTLSDESISDLFNQIEKEIEIKVQNAVFALEQSRVVQFIPSRTGQTLDREATHKQITQMFNQANTETEIVTKILIPEVTNEDLNDLGIVELLGVGISRFAGSPLNRIKNIQNGAHLLHGLLIKPGETFSLLFALGPFTAENGYVPELVIRGDKITPEFGGGLCQIGTTIFRTSMNAGLPIIERQNHSLVVNYYNDLINNNPGTDATIYDPAPDFRFFNDTDHTILIQTEVDLDETELRFSFWGTSDGRKGYYTPPEVLRWIPTGPKRVIETTDLSPGEEKCQSAHPGADAQFTYIVEYPDKEKQERIFSSHYRALPEICLLGIEPPSFEQNTDENNSSSLEDSVELP